MQQPSDEIKSRLDIVEVIRDYIQLKPAGINFRALCPFHQEKTPSFMVSPEKQIWHCFGCSKGGDIFSFVMEMEGISFVEALRLLAPKAGVTLKRQDPKLTSQRNRLLDIVGLSSKYYHKMLLEGSSAGNARKYLAERGLTNETIEEWQIGYSPDSWDDLINLLKGKGYIENEIFLAGMSVKKEGTSRFYNRFRGRIMFPIKDVNGNAVAFSARVSPEKEAEEKMGKYINSPQTMIYNKSGILFGLDKAKMEIKKQDLAIIVEGQMDVITAHQHGFTNVVASSGTALTAEQIALLKRYSPNIALAFDMDEAGDLAAERGIAHAMQAEMNIKVIELSTGKDPDECIKQNSDEWQKAVGQAKPVMQYYFDKTFVNLDLEKVEARRQAAKILLPVIAKLNNKIEQDFWLKKLSQTIDVAENYLLEALSANLRQRTPKYAKVSNEKEITQPRRSREEMLSELLLALMLKFPLHIEYVIGQINADQIIGLVNHGIYKNLIIYYNKIIDDWTQQEKSNVLEINYQDFRNQLEQNFTPGRPHQISKQDKFSSRNSNRADSPEGEESNNRDKIDQLRTLDRLVLLADKDFYDYNQEQAKEEIIKIIITLKKYYLANRLKEITKLIAQTEKEGGEDRLKDLMEEFKVLTEEMREVEVKI
ncbi:DNA primase [Candidatus Parcubacteria bacterium]|nr:DNA primase [Candidatus Parcubacteria bacterium]